MFPLHLHDAILVHCTVTELHIFRGWNDDIRENAERQLQLRFPDLTLAHILEHTNSTYAGYTVSGDKWCVLHRVYTNTQDEYAHVWSLQHDCSLEKIRAELIYMINSFIDDNFLLFIIYDHSDFYIRIWNLHPKIQMYTLPISKTIFYEMTRCRLYVDLLVSPNRQAVFFTDNYLLHFVICCTGDVVAVSSELNANVVWKENQLYADNQLIYTLS